MSQMPPDARAEFEQITYEKTVLSWCLHVFLDVCLDIGISTPVPGTKEQLEACRKKAEERFSEGFDNRNGFFAKFNPDFAQIDIERDCIPANLPSFLELPYIIIDEEFEKKDQAFRLIRPIPRPVEASFTKVERLYSRDWDSPIFEQVRAYIDRLRTELLSLLDSLQPEDTTIYIFIPAGPDRYELLKQWKAERERKRKKGWRIFADQEVLDDVAEYVYQRHIKDMHYYDTVRKSRNRQGCDFVKVKGGEWRLLDWEHNSLKPILSWLKDHFEVLYRQIRELLEKEKRLQELLHTKE